MSEDNQKYYVTLQRGNEPSFDITCVAQNTDAIKDFVKFLYKGYNTLAIRSAGEDENMNDDAKGVYFI